MISRKNLPAEFLGASLRLGQERRFQASFDPFGPKNCKQTADVKKSHKNGGNFQKLPYLPSETFV